MTYKSVYTLSEIRYLWKSRGNKNYEMKCLNTSGNFIQSITFNDIQNHREVSGKLVALPREGEAYHWLRLMHENLAPLLDIVSINENISIYITTASKRSLRDVICEDGFQRDAACLNRKKSYAEDVLWGLDYLHGKNLCLMNLSENNIYINEVDKAVVTDFSHLVLAKRATTNCVSVSSLYRAPELDASLSLEDFDAIKAEIWACGVMLLQIFTGYAIPVTYAVIDRNLEEFVANMDRDILAQANIGASVPPIVLSDFQNFMSLFLCMYPSRRAPVRTAAINPFLKRNPIEQSELNRLDISQFPLCFDVTKSCAEASMGKRKEIIIPDYVKAVNLSSAAIINREKLKQCSPYNKFINLKYIPIPTSRQEDCILDSSNSNQSNWNMLPMEKERITQEINKNQKQIQVIKRNVEEIIIQETKSLPIAYDTSKEANNVPLKNCANAENFYLKSFTNTLIKLNEPNEKLKKVENCRPVKENNVSEPSDSTSKNEFHPMVPAKNTNENINNSWYIKIENDTKNNKTNSVYACTSKLQPHDFERSYTNATKVNNSSKSLSIFPNSSFPCLYPSLVKDSVHWNPPIRRSVSFDDAQFWKPSGIPNAFILDTNNIDQIPSESSSILKWRYFSFHHDKKANGEGDSSPWKIMSEENTCDPFTKLDSERRKPENYSPDSLEASYFDTQEAEETRTNFVCHDRIQFGYTDATSSNKNGLNFIEFFKQGYSAVNEPMVDSKSLANNEPNGTASCPNGSLERKNPARILYGNIETEDMNCSKNLNSNFNFTLTENNCMGVMKKQVDNCSLGCDVLEGSNMIEDNIYSVAKNIYEPKSNEHEQQQMSFLNPTFDASKWNFQMRRDKDIDSETNLSENEIKQDDDIAPESMDHIGVFERNLNALSEVSLRQETVKSPIKKKPRRKSWFRYLCPGCKVYRDDN